MGVGLVEPKNAASVRTVPVPDSVIKALAEHVRMYEVAEDGLLFTTPGGSHVAQSTRSEVIRAAVELAGLPAGTHAHDLRHFYASALIAGGASVRVGQERLGHATATETLNTYAHLWPAEDDSTRLVIARALGNSLVTLILAGDTPQAGDQANRAQ